MMPWQRLLEASVGKGGGSLVWASFLGPGKHTSAHWVMCALPHHHSHSLRRQKWYNFVWGVWGLQEQRVCIKCIKMPDSSLHMGGVRVVSGPGFSQLSDWDQYLDSMRLVPKGEWGSKRAGPIRGAMGKPRVRQQGYHTYTNPGAWGGTG